MPGSFVLTMWARSQVHHFQIVGHGDGWFSVDNGPLFQGLDELVHHYQCRADGLPAQLHDYIVGSHPPLSARRRQETDLHRAVISRDVGMVSRLLSQHPNTSAGTADSQNGEGSTPIHEAAKKGYCEILNLLIDKKPDLTIRDSKGSTALQVCVCVCGCVCGCVCVCAHVCLSKHITFPLTLPYISVSNHYATYTNIQIRKGLQFKVSTSFSPILYTDKQVCTLKFTQVASTHNSIFMYTCTCAVHVIVRCYVVHGSLHISNHLNLL